MDLTELFGGRLPYTEPDDVAELTDGATLSLAGLEITVDHAPGHTGGSVLFRLPGAGIAVGGGSSASPVTCSSPARSAAPTCRAAARRRC